MRPYEIVLVVGAVCSLVLLLLIFAMMVFVLTQWGSIKGLFRDISNIQRQYRRLQPIIDEIIANRDLVVEVIRVLRNFLPRLDQIEAVLRAIFGPAPSPAGLGTDPQDPKQARIDRVTRSVRALLCQNLS
jgi:hypothetical protein